MEDSLLTVPSWAILTVHTEKEPTPVSYEDTRPTGWEGAALVTSFTLGYFLRNLSKHSCTGVSV